MHFCPERLIQVRESLHINKAEAARRLNLSAMAYGRYERGEREPSFSTLFILLIAGFISLAAPLLIITLIAVFIWSFAKQY